MSINVFRVCAAFLLSLVSVAAEAGTAVAADCSAVAVQTAIAAAVSGDTINVPAGNCTWTTGVEIPVGKSVILQGAGSSSTIIVTALAGPAITLNTTASRVTGFGFVLPDGSQTNQDGVIYARGQGWRIDHNTFTNNNAGSTGQRRCVNVNGGAAAGIPRPNGLIDHNSFNRCRVQSDGDISDYFGRDIWSAPTGLGTNNTVYIEDNTFTYDSTHAGNMMDADTGGGWVVRFNTVIGAPVEAHGFGGGRAARGWEWYNNTILNCSPGCESHFPSFLRGGTGMIFNNSFTNDPAYANHVGFDNDRNGIGPCDGTQNYDGNLGSGSSYPSAGWPCRDQIGRGVDAFVSPLYFGNPPYPPQASEPVGIWRNRVCASPPCSVGDTQATVTVFNGDAPWLANCSEWQNETASFDGRCGTGVGLIANRPATCSVGVYYWATDEGEWWSANPGPDGRLYKCTATNTWTLYYTPFIYPHPLQDSSHMLSAPTNLRIVR